MKETPVTTERRPFESKFYFGDKVKVRLTDNSTPIECTVMAVSFTKNKVWYDLETPNGQFLKDIDSAYCEEEQTPRSIVSAICVRDGVLFKPIVFDSQTPISIMGSGSKYEFNKPIVQVRFGVGKDYVGYLIMEEEAWNAFCDEGAKIS